MSLRAAAPDDRRAIARVVEAAFGRPVEAAIVEAVRAERRVVAEFVAEDAGEIVGHVLFSWMICDPPRPIAGLGPLAAAPDRQRQGVGSVLTRRGLEACREAGAAAVVVLGHPTYYPRFGFSALAASRIASPYAGHPAFMALALAPGALDAPLSVAFPAAFDS